MARLESIVFLFDEKIEKYDRFVTGILKYIVDKKPKGKNLLLCKEQRLLYEEFRDELINMRNAIK